MPYLLHALYAPLREDKLRPSASCAALAWYVTCAGDAAQNVSFSSFTALQFRLVASVIFDCRDGVLDHTSVDHVAVKDPC